MTDPKPLSEMELVELERLTDKATPGDRTRTDNQDYAEVTQPNVMQAMAATAADADFIVACTRDTIKRLISMARK